MRQWILRLACAVVLGGTLPAAVMADHHDGYRAATPYNAIVVSRPLPNPAWNMPNFALDCDLPNQNLATYVPSEDCCFGGGCGHGGLFGGCNRGCDNGCNSGCGSIFDGLFSRSCNSGCNSGCNNGCGSIFDGLFSKNNSCCQSNNCGSTCHTTKCNTGCDAGCTIRDRFNFSFGCKNDCNSCNTSCKSSCNTCTTACKTSCNSCNNGCTIRDRFNFGCKSDCNSCNSGCDRGHGFWRRWNSGGDCGCNTGCNSGCGTVTAPAAIPAPTAAPKAMPTGETKPLSYIEPVAFWTSHQQKKALADERVNGCLSCPQHGPTPKHVLPRPTTLGCTGCSTFESEAVFIFGSCRQFFGEPTWCWLHGK